MLFGKLKAGGHVRVVVVKDEDGSEKLGFEYLDGPVTPKPEKIPVPRAKPKRRPPSRAASKPSGPKGGGGGVAAAARLGAEGAAGQGVSPNGSEGRRKPGLRFRTHARCRLPIAPCLPLWEQTVIAGSAMPSDADHRPLVASVRFPRGLAACVRSVFVLCAARHLCRLRRARP